MAMPDWVAKELRENYAKATRAGKLAEQREPRAAHAGYLQQEKALHISLKNGVTVTIPVRLIQYLKGLSPEQLREVEVLGRGSVLHWERLDLDLGVPELIASLFDRQSWMAELGRAGGRRSSPAKAKAARINGRKGGRPRSAPLAPRSGRR